MTIKLAPWLGAIGLASFVVACSGAADPSPTPEPTDKQGEQLLPVVGGGGGADPGTSGKANACDAADPSDRSTWYCGSAAQCAPSCAAGYTPRCNNTTDYMWICGNSLPGGCSHGCAPL